ncbi:MAG: nucleotidyltransferase domain-containing protein [Bacteroidetes bacterium]|nr:nucleotidyltransferase domain-containing protein [Bacteroidota bacterium]MBU2584547.1 nucleotidyltransferase domain-containing protein [Bacteroidota bacterium]
MITKEQINKIVDTIVKNFNPQRIILFGSYANNSRNAASDLDLLIIKDIDVPRYKRGRLIRKYLRGMKVPIDILVYTNEEIEKWKDVDTAFITSVLKKGIVLYG